MALKTWTSGASTVRRKDTLLVNSSTVGHTFIFSSNSRTVTYTAVTGDTTATIAANWRAAINDSPDPEFAVFESITVSANLITVLGPENGAPYSLSVSGTGSVTLTTVNAATGPNDVALTGNWSGSALPVNGDSVVIEKISEGLFWNATTALASINLVSLTVRDSFTGDDARIGNRYISPDGFREYRGTELVLNQCGTLTVFEAQGADAESYKFKVNNGAACALKVFGSTGGFNAGTFGQEVTYWRGDNASNTADIVGGSLAVAVVAGETATLATTRVINGTANFGDGCTLGTVEVISGQVLTRSSITTLTVDKPGSVVEFQGSAATTTATVNDGTLIWNSTGSIGTLTLGTGATLDLTGARFPLTITNPIVVNDGCRIRDPYGRVSTLVLSLLTTELEKITIECPPGKTVTIN